MKRQVNSGSRVFDQHTHPELCLLRAYPTSIHRLPKRSYSALGAGFAVHRAAKSMTVCDGHSASFVAVFSAVPRFHGLRAHH
jgi:hypothetical protein